MLRDRAAYAPAPIGPSQSRHHTGGQGEGDEGDAAAAIDYNVLEVGPDEEDAALNELMAPVLDKVCAQCCSLGEEGGLWLFSTSPD